MKFVMNSILLALIFFIGKVNADELLPVLFDWQSEPALFHKKKVVIRGSIGVNWFDSNRKLDAGVIMVICEKNSILFEKPKYIVLSIPFEIVPGTSNFTDFILEGEFITSEGDVGASNNIGSLNKITSMKFASVSMEEASEITRILIRESERPTIDREVNEEE